MSLQFYWSLSFSLLMACASELSVGANDAASPSSTGAPLPEIAKALRADFDADEIAPVSAEPSGEHHHHHGEAMSEPDAAATYTCPHHPEVESKEPGECPKCKMPLEPKKPAPKTQSPMKPSGEHDHGAH